MDAITLLKQDHKSVRALFKQFEKTSDGAGREEIVATIIRELTVHAQVEEEVFYPAVRQEVPEVDDDVLESYEEHRVAVWLMEQLEGLSPEDERYEARVMVFKEVVEHHVEEEEEQWFPKVREQVSRKELGDLGASLAEAKARRGMPVQVPARKSAPKTSTAKKSAAKKSTGAKAAAPAKKASTAKAAPAKKGAAKKAAAKKR